MRTCRIGSSTKAFESSSFLKVVTPQEKAGPFVRSPSASALEYSDSWLFPLLRTAKRVQMYLQRYMQHFPAAGEIVIFDRSWYNRAGVEHVMGFCTKEQYRSIPGTLPGRSRNTSSTRGSFCSNTGWRLARRNNSAVSKHVSAILLRQWKLSPMDLESFRRWYEYSRARDAMLEATDSKHAPWYLIHSDDKRKARLNCLSHFLSMLPHKKTPREKVKLPKRSKKDAYDDTKFLKSRKFIPKVF